MPWNFPFWQVLRFAAPAILVGYTVVLKHASICFGCGYRLAKLFLEAGFPKGSFQNLEIGHAEVKKVLENPIVRGGSSVSYKHLDVYKRQEQGSLINIKIDI